MPQIFPGESAHKTEQSSEQKIVPRNILSALRGLSSAVRISANS